MAKRSIVTGHIFLIAAASAAGIAAAAGAAPPAKDSPQPAGEARQLVENCDAHKFETVVTDEVDGKPHQSKVKLCGKEGQNDAEWIDTLKDAVEKLNSNSEMRASMRDQIAAALKAEIARLEMKSVKAFAANPSGAKSDALAGIAALPPLPVPKPAQTVMLPPPPKTAPVALNRDYAALPPIPTNPVAPTRVLAGGAASLAAALPRPRMSFICYTPGEAEGPCTGFTRYTLLTVRAGEDLPAGTSLRFVRDGDPQADVELAQLKKGKSVRMTVPADVCRHVVGGKLELRILRAGQEVGTDGPYNLNC
jgi:hypothetical protein